MIVGLGLAGVMLCFDVVAIFLIDRIGRRPLLLVGVAGQTLGLAMLHAPLKMRGPAMSAVTVTNWAFHLLIAVTCLSLVAVRGHAGTFWLSGSVAVGAVVFFYCLVPSAGNQGQSSGANRRALKVGQVSPGIMQIVVWEVSAITEALGHRELL
jgi:hypothetical protein